MGIDGPFFGAECDQKPTCQRAKRHEHNHLAGMVLPLRALFQDGFMRQDSSWTAETVLGVERRRPRSSHQLQKKTNKLAGDTLTGQAPFAASCIGKTNTLCSHFFSMEGVALATTKTHWPWQALPQYSSMLCSLELSYTILLTIIVKSKLQPRKGQGQTLPKLLTFPRWI